LLIANELGISNPEHDRFFLPHQDIELIKSSKAAVIHSHLSQADITNNNTYTAIISKRENEFDGAISHFTSYHTGEYSRYGEGKNSITKFSINREEFINTILRRREFYNQINLSGYANVVEIFLEKMVADPCYLYQKLGLSDNKEMKYCTEKSPYGDTLVKNIEEIREAYYELCRRTI
jgi:hypothetical protein